MKLDWKFDWKEPKSWRDAALSILAVFGVLGLLDPAFLQELTTEIPIAITAVFGAIAAVSSLFKRNEPESQ